MPSGLHARFGGIPALKSNACRDASCPNVIIKLPGVRYPRWLEGTAASKRPVCIIGALPISWRMVNRLLQRLFWTLELVGRIDEITEVRTCTQRRTGIHRRVGSRYCMNFEGFICVWVSAESIQIHDTRGCGELTIKARCRMNSWIEGNSEPKGYTY